MDEIGRGAMGVVYRAHDPVIGRDVAVKTMHLAPDGTSASRPEFVSRFQTEARAAGILTHPNIVVVYDAGEEGGIFYITMELVEGRSLQSMLDAHQTFPMPRTLRILEQACNALDYAHHHNIVHRDIKPANLMITPDDTVKITDFGTAKIMRFNMTQTAHAIGTPSYMSPEQIKGKPVDGRSDIFALGVILYELVTGEKPFPGQNITTVIYKIVNEEPIPPRQLDPSIHPGVCNVIARALAKEPSGRFQTCGEMLQALKNHRSYKEIAREPAYTAPLQPAARPALGGVQPLAAITSATGATPEISRPTIEPVRGTIYDPRAHKHGRTVSTFWLSLLLLTVIGATGYYIWPYTHDVWAELRTAIAKPAKAGDTSDIAPKTSSPVISNPGASSFGAPVKGKSPASPTGVTPPVHQSPSGGNAPKDKLKGEAGAPGDTNAASVVQAPGGTSTANADEAQTGASKQILQAPTNFPPANKSQLPLEERLQQLKTRIEQRLTAAGLSDRVKISLAGSELVLQGRLRPAEHQALLNKLRSLPDWAHVTDDIAYEDVPAIKPDSNK